MLISHTRKMVGKIITSKIPNTVCHQSVLTDVSIWPQFASILSSLVIQILKKQNANWENNWLY